MKDLTNFFFNEYVQHKIKLRLKYRSKISSTRIKRNHKRQKLTKKVNYQIFTNN